MCVDGSDLKLKFPKLYYVILQSTYMWGLTVKDPLNNKRLCEDKGCWDGGSQSAQ